MFSALSHPALRACRRLFLQNYEVNINIGVHEFEKRGEQRVLINVDLFIPLAMSTPNMLKPGLPPPPAGEPHQEPDLSHTFSGRNARR